MRTKQQRACSLPSLTSTPNAPSGVSPRRRLRCSDLQLCGGRSRAKNLLDAVVLVTSTDRHRDHALSLIQSGHRVLLEKPLTGTLDGDRELALQLDRGHPNALMLAFQRRFDAPLQFAKDLMPTARSDGSSKSTRRSKTPHRHPTAIKAAASFPICLFTTSMKFYGLPERSPAALAVGSRLHRFRLTKCDEDFDDATAVHLV